MKVSKRLIKIDCFKIQGCIIKFHLTESPKVTTCERFHLLLLYYYEREKEKKKRRKRIGRGRERKKEKEEEGG